MTCRISFSCSAGVSTRGVVVPVVSANSKASDARVATDGARELFKEGARELFKEVAHEERLDESSDGS